MESAVGTIPESVYATFQLTFAIVTPALMLGRRSGFPSVAMPPHSLALAVTGGALLWVGWFGFNAGSAVAANGTAGPAGALLIGFVAGAILTGVCAGTLGGSGLSAGVTTGSQVWVQVGGVLFTVAWSGFGTFIILKLVDVTIGLRVTPENRVAPHAAGPGRDSLLPQPVREPVRLPRVPFPYPAPGRVR